MGECELERLELDRAILNAVRTGRVTLGAKRTLAMAMGKRARLIIIASNCPMEIRRAIEESAKMAGINTHVYRGSSLDLGRAAGKRFPVSALAVREPGDSNILSLLEGPKVEQD
ncbi:MAG: 50S ribosomal protein L30e [Candidatus Bathyarchaeia archaeon]